ncbi:MAG: hypothetical protein EOO01_32340 [Chitinophagaceae bacterium]|nr:MAG: hypothetical protein EOO01_32340 [Chitinophagaceae bacterium]
MRKILLFLAFVTASCTNDLGRDRLFIAELQLLKSDGTPANNVEVSSFVHTVDGTNSEDLSKAKTDANGNVRVFIPEIENSEYGLRINDSEQYYGYEVVVLTELDFVNYTFAADPIVVYQKAEAVILQLIPTQVSDALIVSLWITGNPIIQDDDWDYVTNPEDGYYFKTRYEVLRNSSITVHYLTENSGVVSESTVELNIGTTNLTHNLEY